jgi:Fe-S-cluster containining protein
VDYQTVTEEEFRAEVARMVANGSTFVAAVYALMDQLSAAAYAGKNVTVACGRGCSFCCYQIVSCTSIEWAEIRSLLQRKPPSKNFRAVIAERVGVWLRYYHKTGLETNPIRLAKDWLGKPCVFLGGDGSCQIYEARPIDCRAYTNSIKCGTTPDAMRFVKRNFWPWERWANEMLLDEEARVRGLEREQLGVTPLPEWLAHDRQKNQR